MTLQSHLACVLWYYAAGLSLALHAHLFVSLWQMGASLVKEGDPFLFLVYAGRAAKFLLGMIAADLAMLWLEAHT